MHASTDIPLVLCAGAIGGFAGPYVVGSLVDRGGYVTCMQVLGGLFLVESALLFGAAPSFPSDLSLALGAVVVSHTCIPCNWPTVGVEDLATLHAVACAT